jgi:anthranilate/para-aminobenzoate synthase component I
LRSSEIFLNAIRFDAFRSIFPAGTVSGAPKIKAVELVSSLERERRGVYAGAVGRFDFADDEMDTCIAIRTMTFKDMVAYLQAGGGIVFDSVEEDEYAETLNKLKGNLKALEDAEREFALCLGSFGFSLTPSHRILVHHPTKNIPGTNLIHGFPWSTGH